MNYSYLFFLLLLSYFITYIQGNTLEDHLKSVIETLPQYYISKPNTNPFFEKVNQQLTNKEKQEAVKEAFRFAWNGYMEHSWGFDENRPVTNESINTRNGWGATIVDALDTLYIMDLKEEFNKAKEYVANIQWDKVSGDVQVFETTIRYVGGLISAYELSQEKIFITKCVELVDRLLPAFDSPTHIPYQYVDFKTGKAVSSNSIANIAELGTLQLEFTRLSQITGDWKYHFTGQRVYEAFRKMKTPYEGLFPHLVNIDTGEPASNYYSWGGMADSFYEYLIKQYVLSKGQDQEKKQMMIHAARGLKQHLLQQPEGKNMTSLRFIGAINDGQRESIMGELACFAPGSLLLAANWIPELKQQEQLEDVAYGTLLGCYQAWIATRTGIAPESFAWVPKGGPTPLNLNDRQKELAKTFGVFPYGSSDYILRPETLESIFYFYQYKKDPTYQDMAWTIFNSLNKYCRARSGFSGIRNVDEIPPKWDNRQESFLFAETFKYLYIIWDEESRFPFDQWVFNTEAHPFRITDIRPPSAKAFVKLNDLPENS